MRQFSIHKVNKPMMRHKSGEEEDEAEGGSAKNGGASGDFDSIGDITGVGLSASGRHASLIGGERASLLTAEEQEALQPKEIKVVNPWIHDATHKEYLESVKVSHTEQPRR